MRYEAVRAIFIIATVSGVLILALLFGPIGLVFGILCAIAGIYGWVDKGREMEEEETQQYEAEQERIRQLEEENKKLRKEKYGDKYK